MSIFDTVFDPETPLSQLDDGRLPVGDRFVILARWADADRGAVFTLSPSRFSDPADGDYDTDVTSFLRRADGTWDEEGSGGGGWIAPRIVRPDMPPGDFQIFGTGFNPGRGWTPAYCFGFCGTDVVSIESDNGGRLATGPIESPVGAFVVVWDCDSPVSISFVDRFDGRRVYESNLG
jgi:hypothetical protein